VTIRSYPGMSDSKKKKKICEWPVRTGEAEDGAYFPGATICRSFLPLLNGLFSPLSVICLVVFYYLSVFPKNPTGHVASPPRWKRASPPSLFQTRFWSTTRLANPVALIDPVRPPYEASP